ncbi:hypothetical protein HanIR_Chr05g0242341 [Helianthus annuus]|nr:hypothetical protein HanIR_Chr05g0242341 [Helianthus annuus]
MRCVYSNPNPMNQTHLYNHGEEEPSPGWLNSGLIPHSPHLRITSVTSSSSWFLFTQSTSILLI